MDLMVACSQKYVTSTSNYLEAATNLVDMVDLKESGLDLLTEMLQNHIKKKKISRGEDISRALKYYYNWIRDDTVSKIYTNLY